MISFYAIFLSSKFKLLKKIFVGLSAPASFKISFVNPNTLQNCEKTGVKHRSRCFGRMGGHY
jgi:hypothetical protein